MVDFRKSVRSGWVPTVLIFFFFYRPWGKVGKTVRVLKFRVLKFSRVGFGPNCPFFGGLVGEGKIERAGGEIELPTI